jgi:Transglycosylase SLT domain
MLPGTTGTQTGSQATASGVTLAISNAARATGTSFEYLLATARVESHLNPTAAAPTSSARGLYQFIEQTWLGTLKEAGAKFGYARYADAITRDPSGRFVVNDPALRKDIMQLRDDPTASASMAAAFTQHNAESLAQRLGRRASDGELYIAHFLGSGGAGRLIAGAANDPQAIAANAFPNAARANQSIFYDQQGRARTIAEVYGVLVGRYDVARAGQHGPTLARNQGTPPATVGASNRVAAPVPLGPTGASTVQTQAASAAAAPAFESLFSDRRSGPVSQIVHDLWGSRPHVAAALTGQAAPPVATTGTRTGAPLDLFSDQPRNVRGLFGGGS